MQERARGGAGFHCVHNLGPLSVFRKKKKKKDPGVLPFLRFEPARFTNLYVHSAPRSEDRVPTATLVPRPDGEVVSTPRG